MSACIRLLLVCLFLLSSGSGGLRAQAAGSEGTPLEFIRITQNLAEASDLGLAAEQSRLFVLEAGRHRLLELDLYGNRQDSLGVQGSGNYQFRQPAALDVTNGLRLYIADSGNGRIQLFERRLSYIAGIQPPDSPFFTPRLLAAGPFGDVFVYDENRHRLLRFDSGGRLRDELLLSFYDELRNAARVLDLLLLNETLFLLVRNDDDERSYIHRLDTGGRYLGFWGQDEDIRRLADFDQALWAATPSALLRYDPSGRIRERWPFELPAVAGVRGLAVSRSAVYLLGPAALFRAER